MTNKTIIGITGGIGSGKTTICKALENMGFPVYYADKRGKYILQQPETIKEICQHFGEDILLPNSKISTKALAEIVFKDKAKLDILNQIIHPKVKNDFNYWCKNQSAGILIKESALIIETNDKTVDFIIAVVADINERISRVIKRDNSNRELIMDRINNQITDEERIDKSDFSIKNNPSDLLIPQILTILKKINSTTKYNNEIY
jgi:dephospho-CoA kinase